MLASHSDSQITQPNSGKNGHDKSIEDNIFHKKLIYHAGITQ
jgi:hypothetical protein